MKTIDKLKLAIYEAGANGHIDEGKVSEMISVCESANLENQEDINALEKVTEELLSVAESVENPEAPVTEEPVVEAPVVEEPVVPEVQPVQESAADIQHKEGNPSVDTTSLKLEIFESEASGQITPDERDLLLSMVDDVHTV